MNGKALFTLNTHILFDAQIVVGQVVTMLNESSEPQYAKRCDKPEKQQVDVVAQFHAHKITPVRIAYRTGIALEFVESLIAGESHPRLFKFRLDSHKKARRQQRLKKSLRLKGTRQLEQQTKIERDFIVD